MAVRLRDFAEVHRISERTVQKQIKDNYDVLREHVDRRGKQGTWLDDFAVEFLLENIQLPTSEDVVMTPSPREMALMLQIQEVTARLADAERRAGSNAEAAGKVLYLEANNKAQEARIADLSVELGQAKEKAAQAEKTAQAASGELAEAKKEIEALKNAGFWQRLRGFRG